MKRLFTLLVLSLSTLLRAQSSSDSLVLTKEQNEKWISEFEGESKSGQLRLLRSRILLDTNIYINEYYADRIKIDNEKQRGKRTVGCGRLLLVFNQSYTIDINNKTKNKSIIELADLLTEKGIKSVSTLKGTQATALYGSRATTGVILLTTDNKTFKQIKEITLE